MEIEQSTPTVSRPQTYALPWDPMVVCVRGPSRSGKTTLCERLIPLLAAHDLNVAFVKRTHHLLDLPGKSSDRIWARRPVAAVMRAPDRLQVTLPPGSESALDVLARAPIEADVVLLETHSPEPFPTILSTRITPAIGEDVIGRWSFDVDTEAAELASILFALRSTPRELRIGLRKALDFHGGHACPGIVLGTRMSLLGADILGVELPDTIGRLRVVIETERCAADAVQAVTGCRIGKRSLTFLPYGRLAATFVDSGKIAIRVAARADSRDAAQSAHPGLEPREAQTHAYAALPPQALFTWTECTPGLAHFERSPADRERHECVHCGEEVSEGRAVLTGTAWSCRPCSDSHREH